MHIQYLWHNGSIHNTKSGSATGGYNWRTALCLQSWKSWTSVTSEHFRSVYCSLRTQYRVATHVMVWIHVMIRATTTQCFCCVALICIGCMKYMLSKPRDACAVDNLSVICCLKWCMRVLFVLCFFACVLFVFLVFASVAWICEGWWPLLAIASIAFLCTFLPHLTSATNIEHFF